MLWCITEQNRRFANRLFIGPEIFENVFVLFGQDTVLMGSWSWRNDFRKKATLSFVMTIMA